MRITMESNFWPFQILADWEKLVRQAWATVGASFVSFERRTCKSCYLLTLHVMPTARGYAAAEEAKVTEEGKKGIQD